MTERRVAYLIQTEHEFINFMVRRPRTQVEKEAINWFRGLTPEQRLIVVTEALRFGKLLNGDLSIMQGVNDE